MQNCVKKGKYLIVSIGIKLRGLIKNIRICLKNGMSLPQKAPGRCEESLLPRLEILRFAHTVPKRCPPFGPGRDGLREDDIS